MPSSKKGSEPNENSAKDLAGLIEQSQLDFELNFFAGILRRKPDYVDVLRVQGNNFVTKGRYNDSLELDCRLVTLKPADALAHYNLACSYALLKNADMSIRNLKKAIELGYRDFRYISQDGDLKFIRNDPRYRELMDEHQTQK